jgi:hypothetical protein
MAKKTKKQKQRAVARRPGGPVTTAGPGPIRPGGQAVAERDAALDEAAVAAPETGEPDVTEAPARRRVERVTPTATAPARGAARGRSRYQGSSAAMMAPLESDDPAIPFDRVPYVPADLRRVTLIALVMLALIIVVAIVVNNAVK